MGLVRRKTLYVHLFDGIPEGLQQQLELIARVQIYPKGAILFSNSLLNKSFFYINSGLVKLYRENKNGNEFIIDVMGPKTYFGDSHLFEENANTRKHFCSAQTLCETQLVIFPIEAIQEFLLQNNQLMLNLLKSSISLHKKRALKAEDIAAKTAVERIGCFLLRICPPDSKENAVLQLSYDKSIIATQLNMQPETFSRALVKLRAQANVRIENDTVYIPSVKALSEDICATCSFLFPCHSSLPA